MTPSRSRIDWRQLDRTALDEAYNSAAAVPDSASIVASWELRSAKLRQCADAKLDLAYGPRPRNRIDFFRCTAPHAPTLAFIHGGYWQMRAKESFAFVASGPLAAGMNVALLGYTLAPAACMDEIVAEIGGALDWLAVELPALGCDPDKLLVSGWSAGAQLAAMTMDHAPVRGCLAISGIYDLEPMRHCYVNDKLGLDEAAALRNSPMRLQASANVPLAIVVGGGELPLMVQQSADYANARLLQGMSTSWHEIPGADHFSILDEMEAGDGQITKVLRDLRAAAGL
jgi:acetyl esterase/lipase